LKRQPEERIAASPKTKKKGEKQKDLCKRQQPPDTGSTTAGREKRKRRELH
jgi:hypothetical protein